MNDHNLYNYYVHKYNVFDRDFIINTSDKIPKIGFRSVYAIREEDAERLRKTGFAGYKGKVWSPVLSLDIDSPERGQETIQQLKVLGYGFKAYVSGSKGVHIDIARVAPPSEHLPYWDKRWVEKNVPGSDTSLYAHLHMYRLEGTRHLDTGNKKTLIETHAGRPILYREDDMGTPEIDAYKEAASMDKSLFNDEVLIIWTAPAENGHRHEVLVNIAAKLKYQYKEPREFVERYLHHTNLLFKEPKSYEEIRRIVEHYYGR